MKRKRVQLPEEACAALIALMPGDPRAEDILHNHSDDITTIVDAYDGLLHKCVREWLDIAEKSIDDLQTAVVLGTFPKDPNICSWDVYERHYKKWIAAAKSALSIIDSISDPKE